MTITIQDTDHLTEAAREFAAAIGSARVIAFHAPMGGGKTTFIRALCQYLGCEDEITSPSFAIVNEYALPHGQVVFHFDFYRLRDINEARAIGLDDYLYSGQMCLIEWPDLIEPLLPDDTLHVTITPQSDGSRLMSF